MPDMPRRAPHIELTLDERQWLERITRSPSAEQREVMRARIVLLAAEGKRNEQIQHQLGVSKPVVVKWRGRVEVQRVRGVIGEGGVGRKRIAAARQPHAVA